MSVGRGGSRGCGSLGRGGSRGQIPGEGRIQGADPWGGADPGGEGREPGVPTVHTAGVVWFVKRGGLAKACSLESQISRGGKRVDAPCFTHGGPVTALTTWDPSGHWLPFNFILPRSISQDSS